MTKALYIIQPLITNYRQELLATLGNSYRTVVLSSHVDEGKNGFGISNVEINGLRIDAPILKFLSERFSYQEKVLTQSYKSGDAAIIFADPRFLSFWLLLILAKIKGIMIFAHGQGSYAYPSASLFRRLMYRSICRLSHRYVCYNEFVRTSMLRIGCNPSKLAVADNSIQIGTPVTPESKDFAVNGVLFIGRLRHGCCLNVAIEAVSRLRQQFPDACLHVVGGGEEEQSYKTEFSKLDWVHFHGPIYDDQQIAAISRQCKAGCYPGNAGLSIVHYFALSLPAIVHSEIHRHMGPEPAYVTDGLNGFLFNPDDDSTTALAGALHRAWSLSDSELRVMGEHAFKTYENLTNPTLGQRFLRILDESGFKPAVRGEAISQ
ncbi:MAG: glycosyltransferase [Pseudoxanthomonas sp.]